MDSHLFDRLVKSFAGITPRRAAVRIAAGAGLGAVATRLGPAGTTAKDKDKNTKKRCRKNAKTCGGKKRCCGDLRCRPFENRECIGVELSGQRCCATEGNRCDPNFGDKQSPSNPLSFGNCSCCANLFCEKKPDDSFRCSTVDT